MIFKVDYEKAYDMVNRKFLDYMMVRFGMGAKRRSWIKECIFKGDLSVLVNGSASEEVKIQRGLKQRDPLLLSLFLMVVEGLTGVVWNAVDIGLFKDFRLGNGTTDISILQYADDTPVC